MFTINIHIEYACAEFTPNVATYQVSYDSVDGHAILLRSFLCGDGCQRVNIGAAANK